MGVAIAVMYLPSLILLIVGFVIKNHHSKFPDVSVGYHSRQAVKEKETWEEANEYAGNYCIRTSIAVLVLDIILMCAYLSLTDTVSLITWAIIFIAYIFVSVAVQLILLLALTSHHLNKYCGTNQMKS